MLREDFREHKNLKETIEWTTHKVQENVKLEMRKLQTDVTGLKKIW